MSLEGGNRKKIEKAARMSLYAAMAAAALLKPEGAMAGKREALSKSEGLKVSQSIEPSIQAGDAPKDNPKDPEITYRIRDDI